MFNEFSRYEAEFEQWVNDGYPDVKPETFDYIKHLSAPKDIRKPREGDALAASMGRVSACHLLIRDQTRRVDDT